MTNGLRYWSFVFRPSSRLNEEPMSTEKSFEDLYRELEETVRKLETGDLAAGRGAGIVRARDDFGRAVQQPCWMAPNCTSAS